MSSILRRRGALTLVVMTLSLSVPAMLHAQGALTRVALFEPAGHSSDPTLSAALATVAESVELSLVVMQRYDVRRVPSADPDTEMPRVRSYCEANHIDQAILGSGAEKPGGGFDFRLLVYDRKTDSITIDRKGSSTGALDMFDTTDALVSSLLDGLSGTHLLFGSLTVDTDPAGATVLINGREAGTAPVSLRGLPVGTIQVTARAAGREEASSTVNVADGETASASLKLGRSVGTLSVQMPSDGQLTAASTEIGAKQLSGPGSLTLPSGTYQLTATSAGLATASGQVVVSRNAAVSWLPWTKGYLDLQTAPAGAAITVDGVAKGSTPQVIEVEPGALHRVALTEDKYEAYVADLSSAAGDKAVIAPKLDSLPGSIRVETSMAGARVSVDDGPDEVTPFVFRDVPAGEHKVKIVDLLVQDRYYTAGPPFTVEVAPTETTSVSRQLLPATARLKILDAPAGTTVQIDGTAAAAAVSPDTWIDVPAGKVSVALTGPAAERWTQTIYTTVGSADFQSIRNFVWKVPRRTTSSQGGPVDWTGVLPFWSSAQNGHFNDQPGTQIARGYLARDDRRLYARLVFSNGAPSKRLSKEFTEVLGYSVYFYPMDGTQARIEAHVRFLRGGDVQTSFGVYDPSGDSWNDFGGESVSYEVGDGELLISVPLGPLKSAVKGRTMNADLFVSNEPVRGPWKSSNETGRLPVDFGL